ncbi:MAG: hypothetical protein P8X80_04975, partial [Desulfobacterales bacterium]
MRQITAIGNLKAVRPLLKARRAAHQAQRSFLRRQSAAEPQRLMAEAVADGVDGRDQAVALFIGFAVGGKQLQLG